MHTTICVSRAYTEKERRRTKASEMNPHTLAAHPFPRLWNIAVMKSGVAAPSPDRITILAASADATYPGNASIRYAFAEK